MVKSLVNGWFEVVLVDFGILMVKVLEYCWDDDDMDVLVIRNVILM